VILGYRVAFNCAARARRRTRRDAGRRYQTSRRGRLAHAERSRRYWVRCKNVTHHGSSPSLLLGHRNLGTTAQYLMIATSKVCATASPLESLDVLVPTAPDLMPA
jgi:hypothetical protein